MIAASAPAGMDFKLVLKERLAQFLDFRAAIAINTLFTIPEFHPNTLRMDCSSYYDLPKLFNEMPAFNEVFVCGFSTLNFAFALSLTMRAGCKGTVPCCCAISPDSARF
jgi:hypothetical protein